MALRSSELTGPVRGLSPLVLVSSMTVSLSRMQPQVRPAISTARSPALNFAFVLQSLEELRQIL